ncbi:Ig-like domain-containing protein [Tahibacter sp. UC22_41]|uniref:Ig-like domain-containing protein n=1 Tax=Tahibacter sp. UC22_41 TaxID=3350178 RepID=UPI0036DC9F93
MQARKSLALALSSALLAACGGGSNSPRAVATPPANNGNGTPVTGVITARFDPTASVIPLPNNLLLSGTTDLTLNIPVANPNNYADPQVAVNALDGWSTIGPGQVQFSAAPKASTLVPGSTIRLFEVTLTGPGGGVTGVVRELAANTDFVTAVAPSDTTGRTVAIVPTTPLKQLTSYMAVVTTGVTDNNGNDATPDQTYFLSKRTSPLCVNGASTEPLLPAATACSLEPLRLLTNSHLAAANSKGITPDKVVVSWVFTTQGITPVLQAAVGKVGQTPAPLTRIAPTGKTIGDLGLGLAPIADIFIGTIDVPYYLKAPANATPAAQAAAVLQGFWQAAPGAYVPPFNAAGLSPTSTNVTFANPFPVATKTETIPLLLTVPNAASGKTRPGAGWPIVIYQHGITRNRTDMFAVSQTLASQGFAVIAIDIPLHGLPPGHPFNIEATPLAATGAHERTFNVDLIKNDGSACPTGQSICPDGQPDPSGAHMINLGSLLTSRDNLRQGIVDLFSLSKAIPTLNYDGVAGADFDQSRVSFVGQSLGSIIGTSFAAFDPAINTAVLSVPGGGIARLLDGSATFGPRIRAGLAAAGVTAGTPDFDRFMGAAQQAIDAADPLNTAFALASKRVLVHEVVGGGSVLPDQVIPNTVPGAPLAGTEALIRALGLSPITATTQAANGVRGATRFTQGNHGSLLDPTGSPAATVEMQKQMASMIVSGGTAVQVSDTSVIRTQ